MYRNICFTINNPTANDRDLLSTLPTTYIIIGEENEGTPHLQGYAELETRTRLQKLKTYLPRAHIEARKGTSLQASKYCKKDGNYVETGRLSTPGTRTDINNLYLAVRRGNSALELFEDYTVPMFKYHKAVSRLSLLIRQQEAKAQPFNRPLVAVLWGAAGTGKTRAILQRSPNTYICDMIDNGWMDGYAGEASILLDDYNGEIPYKKLMRMLDGYRMQLAIKGSSCYKQWNTVYITSNHAPSLWYSGECLPALMRRISFEHEMTTDAPTDEEFAEFYEVFEGLCSENELTQVVA